MSDREHPAHHEPHTRTTGERLNWLRAGVLGANDGIVSTSSLVIGVAAAGTSRTTVLTVGLAGLAAGALSMAAGEYVSVSTQRDTERSMILKERDELQDDPAAELAELADIYQQKGLTPLLARQVAEQLTAHDPLSAHLDAELRIDPDDLANPWQAAFASALSFSLGALIPLLALLVLADSLRIPLTVGSAVLALAITGVASAALGAAPIPRAVVRNVAGGLIAMVVTFGIGSLFGSGG